LAALEPGRAPAQGPGTQGASEAPTFDIIRIEPNGEAVIAGRAAPNTTVELLRDNEPIARALVDPSGQFAIVPPALPTGNSEITLRVLGADGQARLSRDSVAVVVSSLRNAKPLIALTSPDKPTIVLSQPDSATPGTDLAEAGRTAAGRAGKTDGSKTDGGKTEGGKTAVNDPAANRLATNMPGTRAQPGPAGSGAPAAATSDKAEADRTGPVKIVSVEAEEGGRLYVTSQAPPGATVRLYLNDALVAPGSAGADGRVAFTIGRGVRPGDYKVRVDQVDPVSGKVKTRSEVAFNVPATVTKPAILAQGTPAPVAPGPVARLGTPENPATLPAAALPKTAASKALSALPSPTSGAGTPQAAANQAPTTQAPTTQAQTTQAQTAQSQPSPLSAPQTSTPSVREPQAPGLQARAQPEPAPRGAAEAEAPAMSSQPPAVPLADRSPTVFVPEIGTAKIIRGDSLWQISRRIYGKGTRYTVIFDANQPQIRNPDLIYPGQIFVLPADGTAAVPQADRRG
jgi:nucleoid-associated protein YgaU